jgi:valyl-tRNA synthetase
MSDLPKAYEATNVEKKWYEFWEKNGYFTAQVDSPKPTYSIVMPPPNITGSLHMGHALNNTLQDVLIRWKRMSGYEVLWVPGTDHAGIATQTVVERNLMKSTGKRRTEFSRKEFLDHVFAWKEQSQGRILSQLKRQGVSCDWSRLRFTMDEGNNKAVRVMFKKLYNEGLIYRGDYLVNWDPITQTALADDEVEYEEKQSFLWHFSYPLADGSGTISIATTRPETMLGDTAIAVAPKDKRYQALVGKKVLLPLVGREIPIIIDDHVDPAFGTGAVKVTPAHDPNDYQIGIRHDLPMINIMTSDGKINENGGRFQGLSMQEARSAVVEAMKQEGRLIKQDPHVLRVGVSYRSKAVIEPHLSKQWFIKMTSFKKDLRDCVESGKTKVTPTFWESTYYHWIDNLRDWCISRQLWWGHQIPIWYNRQDPEKIICFDGVGLPEEVKKNPDEWVQDPDVLDTWFSAGLWPFSTLGWPDETPDFKKFYPNSTLVTGHDILFFWVARMLLMGKDATGKLPFPEVFLQGLIYGKSYWREVKGGGIAYVTDQERKEYDLGKPLDKDVICRWEKMSKTKGNVIDPNEIIDEYGADAMRMALTSATTPNARQIDLDRRRFEEFRNFTNKIWNGARFVFMNLEQGTGGEALTSTAFSKGLDLSLLTLEDKWILMRLKNAIAQVNSNLGQYAFDQAALGAYEFYWNEFCANYVEIIKPVLFGKSGSKELRENKQKILVIVLLQAIRLLHPMAPFITEELFQILKSRFDGVKKMQSADHFTEEAIEALLQPSCMKTSFPKTFSEDFTDAESKFEILSKFVYAIRNIRGEMGIPTTSAIDVYLVSTPSETLKAISEEKHILTSLIRLNSLHLQSTAPDHENGSFSTLDGVKIFIPLPKELMQQEKERLLKEEKKLLENIEKTQKQLSNQAFIEKAPKELIGKLNATLDQSKKEVENLQARLTKFQ